VCDSLSGRRDHAGNLSRRGRGVPVKPANGANRRRAVDSGDGRREENAPDADPRGADRDGGEA
jgi:hypothetical protein